MIPLDRGLSTLLSPAALLIAATLRSPPNPPIPREFVAMADDLHSRLVAAALPRIGTGPAAASPRTRCARTEFSGPAAERLLEDLLRGARSRLPWRLGPSGHWQELWLRIGLGSALSLALVLWLGRSPWWAVLWPTSCLVVQWAALSSHHEARRQAIALRRRLRLTRSVASLEPEIANYLERVPEDPAARYLLALARLERARPLEALMQLATLRDRHPTSGEVVLLGAIACAQLHRPGQAGRLLSALDMGCEHPWWKDVLAFAHACGSATPGSTSGWAESHLTS